MTALHLLFFSLLLLPSSLFPFTLVIVLHPFPCLSPFTSPFPLSLPLVFSFSFPFTLSLVLHLSPIFLSTELLVQECQQQKLQGNLSRIVHCNPCPGLSTDDKIKNCPGDKSVHNNICPGVSTKIFKGKTTVPN